MKRLVLCTLLLMLSHLTMAQSEVIFDEDNYDFGKIVELDGVVTHTFKYKNTGTEPFVIINVLTSCGCTTPAFTKNALLQGEHGELTIAFDPKNLPGDFAKEIRVISNQGKHILHIVGYVEGRPRSIKERFPFSIGGGARLDGLGISWLQVPLDDTLVYTVPVANAGFATPITLAIDSSEMSDNIKVLPFENRVEAGEIREVQFVISGREYGSFSNNVRFVVNGVRRAEKVVISGVVVDNFTKKEGAKATFSTHYFALGQVARREDVVRKATITNSGGEVLKIRAIESTKMLSGKVNRREIPVGKSAVVTLCFRGDVEGYASEALRIIVNDKDSPVREIRVSAEIIE